MGKNKPGSFGIRISCVFCVLAPRAVPAGTPQTELFTPRDSSPGSSRSRPDGVVAYHHLTANLYYSSAMTERSHPAFRTSGQISLTGRMASYGSQAEASEGIPEQWRLFLGENPAIGGCGSFYGASPCTSDRKIHYLSGVAQGSTGWVEVESLVLEAGEYAVLRVDEVASLRETWTWLLGTWLVGSGRRERNAPEFERYTAISEAGVPVGPIVAMRSVPARAQQSAFSPRRRAGTLPGRRLKKPQGRARWRASRRPACRLPSLNSAERRIQKAMILRTCRRHR